MVWDGDVGLVEGGGGIRDQCSEGRRGIVVVGALGKFGGILVFRKLSSFCCFFGRSGISKLQTSNQVFLQHGACHPASHSLKAQPK